MSFLKIKKILLILATAVSILDASDRRIGLVIRPDFKGEVSFAYRVQAACRNIEWEADIIDIQNIKKFKKKKYDFLITLVPGDYKHLKCKNYLAIFHPEHHYFTRKGMLKTEYRLFDGYLLTYSPGPPGNEKKDFANKHAFSYMRWFPTVQSQSYQATDPSYLFYIGCTWGNRFEDLKFQQLLMQLDKTSYMRLYGSPIFQSLYHQSYQGQIPYDDKSLYEIAAQAGIFLIFHSKEHNKHGIPSGRIFEAAATASVIICDQNAFVQDHFGDSVLYINTEEDAESIHNQIQCHMDWIQENKIQALEKAKKANAIYKESFLLEDQLLRLIEFHEQLSNRPINCVWEWLQAIGSLDL